MRQRTDFVNGYRTSQENATLNEVIAVETRERISNWRSRLWAFALTAALACALLAGVAYAATVDSTDVVADPAAPKPEVVIQGNVVVDKGKPTGFYELALCVRTARTVTLKDDPAHTVVKEEDYAKELAEALEKGDRTGLDAKYEVTYYPFQSAAAAVHINLDALTAVTWGAGEPVYANWTAGGATGTAGSYDTFDTDYPRGIDLDDPDQAKIFKDVEELKALINGAGTASIRLDTAKPDEINNATALIEEVKGDDALLTLSANTTHNARVVYETPTPVVVVRFAYDKNRFKQLDVTDSACDFWLDLDVNDRAGADMGKTPLTYLGGRDTSTTPMYKASDAQVANSSVHQSVWYAQNTVTDGTGQKLAEFYYYLGADLNAGGEISSHETTPRTYSVYDPAQKKVWDQQLLAPQTAGAVVLANRSDDWATTGDPESNTEYSFFQNLLTLEEKSLRLTLVNAETYRKPTGGIGGAQILFYDWDDSLIGALVVDPEGDARAAVNEYIEKTLIHPDLRTGDNIAAAADLTALQADQDYVDRVDSLNREFTYRGDYSYKVGQDTDDTLKRPATHKEPGEDYPLTNKLDYALYRRVTTQTETLDPGTGLNTRYYSTAPVSEGPTPGDPDYDGYLYPYVYGWAIVEDDTQDVTKKNWILRKDSIKTEDVWTTFGVGELADLDPSAAVQGQFTDPADGSLKDYTYAVTEKDAAWYLRFADFSAMENMLREGQDVLIVKAVYEPGTSLLPDNHYTVVDDSLHVERYSTAASTGEAVYSFQYQYQRANDPSGFWQGVKRTREPAVQTGYTYDVNAFDSEEKNLNPSTDTKAFFMKTLSDNTDLLDIDITGGGVLWKIDYVLVDTYGYNIATGVKRSAGGELNLKNNFLYEDETEYADRQGTDGFVLQATLNTLLTEATKGAKGEDNKLREHFSQATIVDLNLKADINATEFNILNYDYCATYLQDLVTRLYKDGVSIDSKTGDVTLGWHQIQRHILMCMQANGAVAGIYSGGTLMSETDCAGFPWCRLDDCAAEVKVDIFDLGDIFVAMDKAKDETGDKHPAKDALDDLKNGTPPLLDGYLNKFRKDKDGRPFKTRQEVYDALKTVYDKLAAAGLSQDAMKQLTEEQVQEIIITKTYPTTGQTYWWWNGGTRPVNTWRDWIEAGMLVVTGDVPDALDGMTNINLPDAVQDMISYERPTTTGTPTNVGWFRYKESDEDDNAFKDVEEFKDKWIQALRVLKDDGHYDLTGDWDTKVKAEWEKIPWQEIQYALITGTYADATTVLATTNYWWRDGGLPRLTYEKLLDAVSEWRASSYNDSTKLDKLIAKSMNPINNEVYIRRTAAGSSFADKGQTQFKNALKTAMEVLGYVTNNNDFADPVTGELLKPGGTYALDIYQFQYLLLNASKLVNKPLPSADAIKDGSSDIKCNYWWIPEPHVPSASQRIGDIMDLLTYAYWAKDGVGDPPITLTFDPLEQLDAATMDRLKLRAEVHGIPYTDETHDDLRQAVLDAITNATSGWPYSIDTFSAQSAADLTKELQNILLGNSYAPASSLKEYWWQGSGFQADTHETLAQAAWIAALGFDADDDGALETAPDAMDQVNLVYVTRRTDENFDGLAMRRNDKGEPFVSKESLTTTLCNAIKAAREADATVTYDSLTGLTNYQLQYLILNSVIKDEQTIKDELAAAKTDYWWFTADEPPKGDEEEKTEVKVDEALWNQFITAAGTYFAKTAGDKAGFEAAFPDFADKYGDLLLRGPGGAELTAEDLFKGDKTDYTWQVLNALYTCKRKSDFFASRKRTFKDGGAPTWYEFQYVLLHLGEITLDKTVPSKEDCESEKTNYDWIWKTSGVAKPTQHKPSDEEWSNFITAAGTYFAKTAGDKAGFEAAYPDLDNNKIATALYLGKDGNFLTAAELFVGDKTDYTWQVLNALYTCKRKSDFFASRKRTFKDGGAPTWEEFQYVLTHLGEITLNKTVPSAEDCKTWVDAQENTPWTWFVDNP